ncbi:MAG: preprotein translocase subunit SecG [Candidatus Omnitrophica bacterium]|nr:preprotein translocase subunit SecG [Candidatus Omnitrophota bacterium]
MNAILVFFHIMACLTLILVILLQVGRGHGLSGASFSQSGVQTVFGTKTADFLSKATSVMAIVFLITCISLDILQARRSRSLFGPARPGAAAGQKVDVQKIREVLEKIKAEQAAKTGEGEESAPFVPAGVPGQETQVSSEPAAPQEAPAPAASEKVG